MRAQLALLALSLAGCAPGGALVKIAPANAAGKDVTWKTGTPMIVSRGERSDVAVMPVAGPTGRYPISDRFSLVVIVTNKSDKRVEVSESSVSVATNKSPARTVLATEVEDTIRTSAAWAQAFNFVATAFLAADTRSTVGRQLLVDSGVRRSAAIDDQEQRGLAAVAKLFQRTTIEPRESYSGGVTVDFRRSDLCSSSAGYARGARVVRLEPCAFDVRVECGGEVHEFAFLEEMDASARRDPSICWPFCLE
jgi:hypothetical protein